MVPGGGSWGRETNQMSAQNMFPLPHHRLQQLLASVGIRAKTALGFVHYTPLTSQKLSSATLEGCFQKGTAWAGFKPGSVTWRSLMGRLPRASTEALSVCL